MSEPTPDAVEAPEPERTTLYAPDGRPYSTSSVSELNRLRMAGYSDTAPTQVEVPGDPGEPPIVFDPAEHNVDVVLDFIADHPDQADAVIAAEAAGKNRVSITGA